MRRKSRFVLGGGLTVAAVIAAAAIVLLVGRVNTSEAQVGSPVAVNQYSAKFLCGAINSPASPFSVLAPGVYNTAVNIHNANNFAVTIQKKAVLSVIEPGQGLPGTRQTHVLAPDASMEVDCSEIFVLLATANPSCTYVVVPPPPAGGFCKGYLVVEAAYQPAGQTKYYAAQIDVTDILTVKEEDGIWKDYTFKLHCNPTQFPNTCPLINDINTGVTYRYEFPYNVPDRPTNPPCYGISTLTCDIYDVEDIVMAAVDLACGNCGIVYQGNITMSLLDVAFATDSRDVTLDFEFVSPKRITYPCWPKGTAGCP